MCKRKFGQILRAPCRARDLLKKNSAREEDNELWLDARGAGFGSNTLVTGERLLSPERVRCKGKERQNRIAYRSRNGFYGMDGT
jgi:hypothetical protein